MRQLVFSLVVFFSVGESETRYINILSFVGDARLVAMGFDGQGALDGHPYLFSPSHLPPYRNVEVSYSIRPINWVTGEDQFFSYLHGLLSLDTSEAVGAYFYRNSIGRQVGIATNAKTFYGNVEPFQYLFSIFYRKMVLNGFSFGVAVKHYSGSNSPFFFDIPGLRGNIRLTGSATVADIGLHHEILLDEQDRGSDGLLSLEASLTNFGSWSLYKGSFVSITQVSSFAGNIR